ncbi:LD-carboxypeptidase [Pantoea ananatis]|uniref:LD-carboxypeptidase n=1 Tax=Pantoea ananas TaxID=553 RepID=UPI001EE5348E|nr:LD-carboxypeptidase [Pantoea ananatis]
MYYLWFVRGGSGALNLYPALHSSRKRISSSTPPKNIVGFSDVTAVHSFVDHELNQCVWGCCCLQLGHE